MSAKQYVDLPDLTVYHEELMEYLSEQGMSDAIILQGVLTSGSNSITFTNSNITSSSRFDIYASQLNLYKTSMVVSGNTLTVTFDSAPSSDVLITLIVNWDRGTVDPTYFGGLYDVNITNPLDGQVPRYNAQTSKWENGDASVVGDLNDLDDVNINSPQEGDVLVSDENGIYQNKPVLNDLYKTNGILGVKNLLPINVTSKTINGVTFTVNTDGSVTANGTATALTVFDIGGIEVKRGQPYILSGGASANCRIDIRNANNIIWTNNTESKEVISPVTSSSIDTFTPNSDETVYVKIRVPNGAVINNKTVYPMIRLATDTDDTYVPYAMTNRELTDAQKVTTISVDLLNWTSDTTSQSGTTLYKKQISVNHVYVESPTVDIGSSGVLPTVAEQESYNLLQYVTCDDSVPCLYLYASAIPTTAFYIKVEGVD